MGDLAYGVTTFQKYSGVISTECLSSHQFCTNNQDWPSHPLEHKNHRMACRLQITITTEPVKLKLPACENPVDVKIRQERSSILAQVRETVHCKTRVIVAFVVMFPLCSEDLRILRCLAAFVGMKYVRGERRDGCMRKHQPSSTLGCTLLA
jgi:hypothetical protein